MTDKTFKRFMAEADRNFKLDDFPPQPPDTVDEYTTMLEKIGYKLTPGNPVYSSVWDNGKGDYVIKLGVTHDPWYTEWLPVCEKYTGKNPHVIQVNSWGKFKKTPQNFWVIMKRVPTLIGYLKKTPDCLKTVPYKEHHWDYWASQGNDDTLGRLANLNDSLATLKSSKYYKKEAIEKAQGIVDGFINSKSHKSSEIKTVLDACINAKNGYLDLHLFNAGIDANGAFVVMDPLA